MKHIALAGIMVVALGCGNVDNDSVSSEVADGEACPELARPDEMWINVTREDSRQMNNLIATFHFDDTTEEWKCEHGVMTEPLCQAVPHMVSIIAKLDNSGEITAIDLDDLKGASYSGDVVFEWSELPVSYRCSNTYRKGVFDVTLVQ